MTFAFVSGKQALDFSWLFYWQYYPIDAVALSKQNLFLRNSERNTQSSLMYAKLLDSLGTLALLEVSFMMFIFFSLKIDLLCHINVIYFQFLFCFITLRIKKKFVYIIQSFLINWMFSVLYIFLTYILSRRPKKGGSVYSWNNNISLNLEQRGFDFQSSHIQYWQWIQSSYWCLYRPYCRDVCVLRQRCRVPTAESRS